MTVQVRTRATTVVLLKRACIYSADHYFDSPVCHRVIKAAVELGAKQGITSAKALDKYCAIATLEVEDQKFCYNIDTIGKDISRLLEMGADEFRVCKKVSSINPDFCTVKIVKSTKTGEQLNDRLKKGIIYE